MKKLLFGGSTLLLAAGLHGAATITITQIGNHVHVTGSGTLNLSLLDYDEVHSSWDDAAIQGSSLVFVGADNTELEAFSGISGPATFGNSTLTTATSGSGSLFGVMTYGASEPQYLMVPWGYNGEELSSNNIYENQSLASLGLNEGSYTWVWETGGGNTDSLTLVVQQVPEPATYAAVFGLAIAGFALQRRSRR